MRHFNEMAADELREFRESGRPDYRIRCVVRHAAGGGITEHDCCAPTLAQSREIVDDLRKLGRVTEFPHFWAAQNAKADAWRAANATVTA